jgi:hypothetical protein
MLQLINRTKIINSVIDNKPTVAKICELTTFQAVSWYTKVVSQLAAVAELINFAHKFRYRIGICMEIKMLNMLTD